VDYSKAGIVKNALFNYNELMAMARKGDQTAGIICVDIKRAVHADNVLTFKQRRYLSLWWQGFDYVEIATMFRKDPTVVKRRVDLACGRLSKYLCEKRQF